VHSSQGEERGREGHLAREDRGGKTIYLRTNPLPRGKEEGEKGGHQSARRAEGKEKKHKRKKKKNKKKKKKKKKKPSLKRPKGKRNKKEKRRKGKGFITVPL